MRRFVNGVEADLSPTGAEVSSLPDRLAIRTAEGTFTTVAVRVGDTVHVSLRGQTYTVKKATRVKEGTPASDGDLRAPMPGLIVDVLLKQGSNVVKGEKILVLEAMKTQQAFVAPFDGTLRSLQVAKGDQVTDGQVLAVVQPREEE